MVNVNSVSSDQKPHFVASDLGLQFANYFFGVSRLTRDNIGSAVFISLTCSKENLSS